MPVKKLTDKDVEYVGDYYSQCITDALGDRETQVQDWQDWLQLYDSKPKVAQKNYPWEGASNIEIGLTPVYVDTYVARILGSIFGVSPHWVVTQQNKKYAEAAKPLEKYLDWCRDNMWNQYKIVKAAVTEACKLGTSSIFNGWENKRYLRWDNDSNIMKEHNLVSRPSPMWVPREDILVPEGYADFETAPWIGYRQWFSRQDLKRLAWENILEGVDEVIDKGPDENVRIRDLNDETQQGIVPVKDGLYGIWQVWCRDDLDEDGYPEELVFMIHPSCKKVLRSRDNIYAMGMRPFVKICFLEKEGKFDGIGIPEMVRYYQEEVSTMHNQRRDNGHLANTTLLKARAGSGVKKQEKIYPGRVFLVSDVKDLESFQLGSSYAFNIQEEAVTMNLAEKRVGVSDMTLGRESPPLGRATATTVMSLMQENAKRFDLNIGDIRRALTLQGQHILELFQTHQLPKPEQSGSPEQVLDEEDALKVRTLIESKETLVGLVNVKLNLSTAAVNKEVEKQSTIQLMDSVSGYYERMFRIIPLIANPQVPEQVKQMLLMSVRGIDDMMKRVFHSHDTYDLDNLLLGDLLSAGGANQGIQGPSYGPPQGNSAEIIQQPVLGGLPGEQG